MVTPTTTETSNDGDSPPGGSGGNCNSHHHPDGVLSDYLLHRIGLLSDEIDWPQSKSEAIRRLPHPQQQERASNYNDLRDSTAIDEISHGAWRVRDPLHSILGKDAYVSSETGLTIAAAAADVIDAAAASDRLNDPGDDGSAAAAAGGGGDFQFGGDGIFGRQQQTTTTLRNITEEILKPMLPSPAQLVLFITNKNNSSAATASATTAIDSPGMEIINYQREEGKINIQFVHAAFNAAAYSIVRGNQRRALEKKKQEMNYDDEQQQQEEENKVVKMDEVSSNDDSNYYTNNSESATTTSTILQNEETAAGSAKQHYYEPPLIQAFESIRSVRMTSLSEASGKSVPAFLKKKNSIPWFHTPVDGGGGNKIAVVASPSSKVPMEVSSSPKDAVLIAKKKTKGQSSASGATTAAMTAAKTSTADVVIKKRPRESECVTSSSSNNNNNNVAVTTTDTKNSPLKKRVKVSDDTSSQQQPPSSTSTLDDVTSTMKSPSSENKTEGTITSTPSDKAAAVTPKRRLTTSSRTALTISSSQKKGKSGSQSRGVGGANTSSSSSNGTKQFSSHTTRAILCAAASLVFEKITPNTVDEKQLDAVNAPWNKSIDPRNIPQNSASDDNIDYIKAENPVTTTAPTSPPATPAKATKKDDFNIDTVLDEANLVAKRTIEQIKSAAHSSDRRREFLMDCSLSRIGMGYDALSGRYHHAVANDVQLANASMSLVVFNPFAGNDDEMTDVEWGVSEDDIQSIGAGNLPQYDMSNDEEWTKTSKPRLLNILRTGAGNAILHDREWTCRAYRVANLLQNLAVPHSVANSSDQKVYDEFVHWNDIRLSGKSSPSLVRGFPNYGPHLIVTTSQDFDTFVAVFNQLGNRVSVPGLLGDRNCRGLFITNPEEVRLRALPYHGDESRRRRLREHFANSFGGLPNSTYHVVVTTYDDFVEDYTNFCHVPFQAVIMDDGMSWLGCAHYDPQGDISKVWNSAVWSKAGSNQRHLNPCRSDIASDVGKKNKTHHGSSKKENELREENKLQIGLTARHRIIIASNMHANYRGQLYKAPVPGLLSLLTPQFMDVIRDDWERCKLYNCKKSMEHVRSLIARSLVVYSGDCLVDKLGGLFKLSLASMKGELSGTEVNIAHEDDELDEWVKQQKIVQTRKFAAAWFRPLSPIRKSFGKITFNPIITTLKKSSALGFVCDEIVTASSLTMSGQNGGVVGLGAYRAAVRCCRSFNSEQGLRQHIVMCHAPPDTWLCRCCGGDCGSSQARSHHERSCGVEEEANESFGGVVPSVGKAPKSRGPKKKIAKNLAAAVIPDKDDDGSTRVLGYRGVWLKNGKYFIKVGGVAVTKNVEGKETTLLLDKLEEAAKRYDDVITTRGRAREVELNYREDGSRIMYDDKVKETPEKSTDTAAVVPALSVVNIKDLPKHVKPLLRDPNQTSRTGGNSKRYVYAYRGVCRQQRKGHDRWQSQISFNGQNHYLGTFDSEWDAAAVYAWAHLILYGEEATRQTQREGEEAAAKFEQRKKDIAEGKISPDQKPVRKKNASARKQKASNKLEENAEPTNVEIKNVDAPEKSSVHCSKRAPGMLKHWNKLKFECTQMLSSGTKGTSKATILGTRKDIADRTETSLRVNIPCRMGYGSNAFLQSMQWSGKYSQSLPSCISLNAHAPSLLPRSGALLIGLQANDFSWQVKDFMASCQNIAVRNYVSVSSSELYGEYGISGMNAFFRTMIVSSPCVLGRASDKSQEKYSSMHVLNRISANMESTLGMTIDDVDCNVNGPKCSCTAKAAEIIYMPSNESKFRLSVCNDDDIVTINGQRIVAKMGHFPLKNLDVCSVGARVFVFVNDY